MFLMRSSFGLKQTALMFAALQFEHAMRNRFRSRSRSREGDLSRPIGRKPVGRQPTTTTTTTTTDGFDLLYFADPFFNDVVLRPLGEVIGFPPDCK